MANQVNESPKASERTEVFEINMGPQHPSTHGVFRAVVELDGETVVNVTPHLGYLHRGIEKLSEHKRYYQIIPLTDRLDYMAGSSNNLGYCLAVEKLLGIEAPERAQYIRLIITELSRISSHLFWAGANAHDLGAMAPFFYMVREREQILYMFEMVSGGRLTPSYMRIGGVAKDIPDGFETKCMNLALEMDKRIDEYETLLTENPIWRQRTEGVGVIPPEKAVDLGITGPMARGSGIDWDLRRDMPYSQYDKFEFEVPIFHGCDAYDRYRVRMKELHESAKIIRQALQAIPKGPVLADAPGIVLPSFDKTNTEVESLIQRFMTVQKGFSPPEGEIYQAIEAPRGELGFYIVSRGDPMPYRMKIRSPTFVNLESLKTMCEGHIFSDMITSLSSVDLVLAEVDR
jgi:NADH-quinone oxidoreductase subunit D